MPQWNVCGLSRRSWDWIAGRTKGQKKLNHRKLKFPSLYFVITIFETVKLTTSHAHDLRWWMNDRVVQKIKPWLNHDVCQYHENSLCVLRSRTRSHELHARVTNPSRYWLSRVKLNAACKPAISSNRGVRKIRDKKLLITFCYSALHNQK